MLTIIDVVLEINPGSCGRLRELLATLAQTEYPGFPRVSTLPHLHFMSMQIFEDRHYDPLLVFENNIDGDVGNYWGNVMKLLGEELRQIFACAKVATDTSWKSLFRPGSSESLLPFIDHFSVSPSASHIGAVGVPVERIHRERDLFIAVQSELGVANALYYGLDGTALQQALRAWALKNFAWLGQSEGPTIKRERQEYRFSNLRVLRPWLLSFIALSSMLVYICVGSAVPHSLQGKTRFASALLGGTALLVFAASASWFLTTLRNLEETDFNQANATVSPDELVDFAKQEDQIVQNHLGSMVLVKPGAIRSIVIHSVLFILRLYVPLRNYDGYLGAMRTIHFAHWTLIGNSGRLLFLSNFDGSWQSYLDDFVDKAAIGLTLAWGNCVGFPSTKDLVTGGATHGLQFKAWARQSQTQNLFWFSAYKDLTVNQILRNAAISDGLRKRSLTEKEATEWAALL